MFVVSRCCRQLIYMMRLKPSLKLPIKTSFSWQCTRWEHTMSRQPESPWLISRIGVGGRSVFSRNISITRPRYIHPVIVAMARPLSKIVAMLVGRGIRKWWASLPRAKRKLFKEHFKRTRAYYIGGTLFFGAAAGLYLKDHLTTTPITKRRRFMLFTTKQISELAKINFNLDILQQEDKILPHHHPSVTAVIRVAQRLLKANREIPQFHTKFWTVTVLDDPLENCYVFPNGHIVMYMGMLELLDSEDQLAIILSHEMSHALLEHTGELMSYASLLDFLMLLPLCAFWALLPSDILAGFVGWVTTKAVQILAHLPYSRKLESEADIVGLLLSAVACYDVREASALWGKMDVIGLHRKSKEMGDVQEIGWLSTHPTHLDRQELLDLLMDSALEVRKASKCPGLPKIDPRFSVKALQKKDYFNDRVGVTSEGTRPGAVIQENQLKNNATVVNNQSYNASRNYEESKEDKILLEGASYYTDIITNFLHTKGTV